jgi:oxygen-independent coproporphyrinogen-3 oxidase
MIFFPGSKFSEGEKPSPDVPEIAVRVSRAGEQISTYASMKLGAKFVEAYGEATPNADITDMARVEKISIGRAVFGAGKALLGYTNAWGILTGVRPAKVANEILSRGADMNMTKRILRDEYFLNPKKAALAVSVAAAENKLVKRLPENLCSVYISIPFCPSRCAYCSFVSASGKLLSLVDDYLARLFIDIDNTFAVIRARGFSVATVYIGGGTPTVLTPKQLSALLSRIGTHVDPASLLEFTLEAGRPDTITEEKLAVAYAHGVTRISVNPQTLSDEVLRSIGRKHTVSDFFRAYELAAKSGIRDVNIDLIAGLPGDGFKSFSSTVDRILPLGASNLTVHTFCIKKASNILKEKNDVYSITGGDVAKCVEYSQLRAKAEGYRPYYMYRQKNMVGSLENVGYAKEGADGLYNIFMMEEIHSIIAVGAGAVTKFVCHSDESEDGLYIERCFAPKYPYEYLEWDGYADTLNKIRTFDYNI